jgi:hypothetical protein
LLHPDLQWDTYVTFGVTADSDATLAPNFEPQANGLVGDFTLDDSGWVTQPIMAGETGRVLIAQLTVGDGISIDGSDWMICWSTPGIFGELVWEAADFSVPGVPGPPTAGLFLLGLWRGRPRRDSRL